MAKNQLKEKIKNHLKRMMILLQFKIRLPLINQIFIINNLFRMKILNQSLTSLILFIFQIKKINYQLIMMR
jgi:hypothetical protein